MLRPRVIASRVARRLRSAVRRVRPAPTRKISIRGTQITFKKFEGDTADQIIGGHETEVYDYIAGLPANSVFYDLGSSIGNFAIFAALRGLTVIAFEPDPASFGSLLKNLAGNKTNTRAYQIAISNGRDEHGLLFTNSEKSRAGDHHRVLNLEKSAAHPGILVHLDKRVEVTTLSIDQAVERLRLPPPNYMKIDIDGSEVAFLEGAESTLSDSNLQGFIFELYKPSEYYPSIVETISRFGFRDEEGVPNLLGQSASDRGGAVQYHLRALAIAAHLSGILVPRVHVWRRQVGRDETRSPLIRQAPACSAARYRPRTPTAAARGGRSCSTPRRCRQALRWPLPRS